MNYREIRIKARELYKKCLGVMLLYIFIFYCLRTFVLLPAERAIWNLILSTTPNSFITDKTILTFIENPQCIAVGLLLVALFCAFTAWELSGILLCLEYYRQDKPIKFTSLFILSLKNIKHLAKPKNWMFFVYIIVIMPFIDVYSAAGMVQAFAVPEYISDFIMKSLPLRIGFYALIVFLVILCIRWFYSMQGVLICHKDFKEACKESEFLLKGRTLRQIVDYVIFVVYQIVTICLIPILIAALIAAIEIALMGDLDSFVLCGRYTIFQIFVPLFKAVISVLLKMSISSYFVENYYAAAQFKQLEPEPMLPEKAVKKGRIWKFKFIKPVIMGGAILLPALTCPVLVAMVEEDPANAAAFTTDAVVAAHKGYSSEAPENTMLAFEEAVNRGTSDMIELDIRESDDGIPVVIHNESMKDATGVNSSIYDVVYDEIKTKCASYQFQAEEFPDAYIPTLEEVLAAYGNKIDLLIEIKMSDETPDLPQKIVDLINKYDCKEHCMIHSGSYEALEKVKAIDDTIPCGLIVAIGTGSYYNLPCADFFSVEHTFVNANMIDTIHSLGKKVYAWTVNDDSAISEMAATRVDGIITDYPDEVYNSYHSFDQLVTTFIYDILPTESDPFEAATEEELEDY